MTAQTPNREHVNQARTLNAFRTVRQLIAGYTVVTFGTLVAAYLMRNHHDLVTPQVWVRGTIVAVTSVILNLVAARAARGSAAAFLRLRIISAVLLVAIVVILAVPGSAFPLWMKVVQGVCGVLLIGVAAISNGSHLRSLFTS